MLFFFRMLFRFMFLFLRRFSFLFSIFGPWSWLRHFIIIIKKYFKWQITKKSIYVWHQKIIKSFTWIWKLLNSVNILHNNSNYNPLLLEILNLTTLMDKLWKLFFSIYISNRKISTKKKSKYLNLILTPILDLMCWKLHYFLIYDKNKTY